jgi:23S rRNA (cytosine1962-C5)-methyltransferase
MTTNVKPYKLLDAGAGRKIELLGEVMVERQAAVAFWEPLLPKAEWAKAQAVHVRSEKGGGHWTFKKGFQVPESWWVEVGGLELKTKLTDFGHCGFFSEQQIEWAWLRKIIREQKAKLGGEIKVLNLFAYTGGGTCSMAVEGAHVTHVDAAGGIVDWAKENAARNLPNYKQAVQPRFIVEDCNKFLEREIRRGSKYHAVVMDPPTYGRGSKKEVFQIEKDIGGLLQNVSKVLVDEPLFVHFSSHTAGFSPIVLEQLFRSHVPAVSKKNFHFAHSEMVIPVDSTPDWHLPSGQCLRAHRLI